MRGLKGELEARRARAKLEMQNPLKSPAFHFQTAALGIKIWSSHLERNVGDELLRLMEFAKTLGIDLTVVETEVMEKLRVMEIRDNLRFAPFN